MGGLENDPNLIKINYLPGNSRVYMGTNTTPFEMFFQGDLLNIGSENEISKYKADNGEDILTSTKPISIVNYRLNNVSRLKLDALNIIRGFDTVEVNGQNVLIKNITTEIIQGTNLVNVVISCQINNNDKFIDDEA
jgi:hypothetical protein